MPGTVTEKVNSHGEFKEVVMTCVADAAAASFPDTAFTENLRGWYLERVVSNPGSTAPTVDSDLTLVDSDGVDVLGGAGANLISNTVSKHAFPLDSSVPVKVPITDGLTQKIANNIVNSATVVLKYIFSKPR